MIAMFEPLLADFNVGLFVLQMLLFLTSLFLMLLILVQRGKGGGLTGALGGAGGGSPFGAKAGDAFTRITVIVAIFWILLCIVTISFFNKPPVPMNTYGDSSSFSGESETSEGGEATPENGDATTTDENTDPASTVTTDGDDDANAFDPGLGGDTGDSGESQGSDGDSGESESSDGDAGNGESEGN